MIRISRNSKDENGNLIKPSKEWFSRAKNETKLAVNEGKNHNANRGIYAHKEVRNALEKLFHDKCAYCETRTAPGFDWEVEHYRPKGEVATRPDHPGYYWLIYDWKNLLPACTHCNQYRITRSRWGEIENSRGGKSTQFPIRNESKRAMNNFADINKEDPLLLNPCKDNPVKHIHFDITGQIHSKNGSIRGQKTIEICHLKRASLRKDRERILVRFIGFLKMKKSWEERREINAANELDQQIREAFLTDDSLYAGLIRYVYKFPWKFGV